MQILLLPGPDAASALGALSALGHRARIGTDPDTRDGLVLALSHADLAGRDLRGFPSALWALDDPWAFDPDPGVRWIFSADPHAAARYARPAEVLAPCCGDVEPKPESGVAVDLLLAGPAHPRRILVLQALKDAMPGLRIAGPAAEGWPPAQVVLVVSRDAMEGNRRRIPPQRADRELYEAAGRGCCTVTDRTRAGAFEAYREGEEVLAYEAIRDLPPQVEALLADPARRRALGEAARARTLAEHTLGHRLCRLLAIIPAPSKETP